MFGKVVSGQGNERGVFGIRCDHGMALEMLLSAGCYYEAHPCARHRHKPTNQLEDCFTNSRCKTHNI